MALTYYYDITIRITLRIVAQVEELEELAKVLLHY